MSARLSIDVETRPFERVDADVLVSGFFSDDRPLRGAAARADWRLCGLLSSLILDERLTGAPGEALLVPSEGRMRAPRVLIVGLGPRRKRPVAQIRTLVRDASERIMQLGLERAALGPLGFAGDDWPRHAEAIVEGSLAAVSSAGRPLELALVVPSAAEARSRASIGAVIDALGDPQVGLLGRDDGRGGHDASRRRRSPQGQASLHRSP